MLLPCPHFEPPPEVMQRDTRCRLMAGERGRFAQEGKIRRLLRVPVVYGACKFLRSRGGGVRDKWLRSCFGVSAFFSRAPDPCEDVEVSGVCV